MPLRALSFALGGLLAAPTGLAVVPATPVTVSPEALEPALTRLRELFATTDGRLAAPKSPRFASLCDPTLSGTHFVIGWLLPALSGAEAAQAVALAAALGQGDDGRLSTELSPLGGNVTGTAAIDEIGGAELLVISVRSTRRGMEKELELGVLGTVARLGADASAPFAGLARRALSPLSRVVVEVHPPEPARTSVRLPKPSRHVIERGDTLSEIALTHGLDLEALVRLNGVDPKKPIRPGDELKLEGGGPLPKLYVAKSGDTLAKVAKHFGVSEQALSDANRIERSRPLSPGQKLVLPR
jgi:LysM repeat protein